MRDPNADGDEVPAANGRTVAPMSRHIRATSGPQINGVDNHYAEEQNEDTILTNGIHKPYEKSQDLGKILPNGSNGYQAPGKPSNTTERLVPEAATALTLRERPSHLLRARSDLGPRNKTKPVVAPKTEQAQIRHGWDDEYNSNEYLSLLHSTFYMYYTDKRHESSGIPSSNSKLGESQDWRMKDRLKTVSAALAVCLNIGVDPPDVIKTNPTAKLEAWTDPTGSTSGTTKQMELIGRRLQDQYETLSLRCRYKQYLDPSIEETKRFCVSLRRNAKDERVLLHYNGHGVPLPTSSGELWVFNKNYTQYIPVGIYDIQSWLAGPSLFVYDVSHAENIVANFQNFIEKHEKENADIRKRDPNAVVQNYSDCIQLAACGRNEMLPTNPNLPADLFTCCLTTPIDIALRFFVIQNPLPSNIQLDDGKIPVPGRLQDRRSPLGELNWIFTAITDTIAWNTLPRVLFKRLFRQDLMVAALFRNFLLSERIMRANHCHPISSPELPETHHHPLWQSWDLALEMVVAQLPALIEAEENKTGDVFQHSSFFNEQLTAFEMYLASGPTEDHAPAQLPIVLQVLLSQVHRLRALVLLSKFLDLGPWAVHLALSIGIFPYVVKLLQAASLELKPVMVFIWARIMAVDYSVQQDLLKDNGIHYFISILNPNSEVPVSNAAEHRAMCAFIVAIFCKNFPQGQTVCLLPELFQACLVNMMEPENPLLRQWSCLCLSMLWYDYPDAKWLGIRHNAHVRLCDLSLDPVPEVRAAMLHALTSFLAIPDLTDQVVQIEEGIAAAVLFMTTDGSVLVKKELLVFFSTFVKRYENKFVVCAYEELVHERNNLASPAKSVTLDARSSSKLQALSQGSIYGAIWSHIMVMSIDPYPEIAQNASSIVDYVHESLSQSPLGDAALNVMEEILSLLRKVPAVHKRPVPEQVLLNQPSTSPEQHLPKQKTYISLSLKRTASSLRNFAFGSSASDETAAQGTNALPQKGDKPHQPPKPINTPRGRLPPEWSHPPETNDPTHRLTAYHPAVTPTSPGFDPEVGLNQSAHLPLRSTFIDWSTEYFREPQMKPNEPDEPGSADYNQRLWRRSRNERIIGETQPLKQRAGSSKWVKLEAFLNNQSQPLRLAFHQFDDHLAVTDDRDTVSIWDFTRNVQLSRFSNANPLGSKINDARFMNEDDQPLLMVGSSDGVLKIYRNYEDNSRVKVVTAFRALTELVPSNRNAGLVFEWQQGSGKALVAGDTKVIRVWNAATEVCALDIPARSSSCVTSLTSDQVSGDVFVAGFGDGVVRVFDQRLNPRTSLVKVWRVHRQWVVNVHMQRGGVRELVSGSRNGEVMLWDLRNDKPVSSIDTLSDTHHSQLGASVTMRSLSVHEHAPVLSVGTDRHEVKSFDTSGEPLGVFEPVAGGWRGTAGGIAAGMGRVPSMPMVATAYHPHRMLLACAGLGDAHVSLVSY